jgi:polyisoprenoid-binding protein YceI
MRTRWMVPATGLLLAAAAGAAPTQYKIDTDQTHPSFEAEQFGFTVWRGRVNKCSGSVVYDMVAGSGSVEIEIDMASIDFGVQSMNEWGRGEQLFDVSRFATSTYKARFEGASEGASAALEGELTLMGVTRPVTLTMDALRCESRVDGKGETCSTQAQGRFRRDEFGLDAGRQLGVNMEVSLRIPVTAVTAP